MVTGDVEHPRLDVGSVFIRVTTFDAGIAPRDERFQATYFAIRIFRLFRYAVGFYGVIFEVLSELQLKFIPGHVGVIKRRGC